MVKKILQKIKHKWVKLRLQPISVYCLHHVCAEYDAETMVDYDWIRIEEFKANVLAMRQDGVEFISLSDAYRRISDDKFRCKKYSVLTFDDGYASLMEILPWLEEQNVPVTLFINGKYLDGKSYRQNPKEKYLNKDELFGYTSSFIEIGSHGWNHTDATQITEEEFSKSIERNVHLLSTHPRYVPFHAYTWGKYSEASDKILRDKNIIPVLIDGMQNYNGIQSIHRELLDV